MNSKWFLLLLLPVFSAFLSGCWSYHGLNQMTIIAGISIDREPESSDYKMAFEIIDVSAPVKEKGPSSKIIESQGSTLMETIQNAGKKLADEPYFGNMQTVIISHRVAEEEGVGSIIDFLIKYRVFRETMNVIISQEDDYLKLLQHKGMNNAIISMEIMNMLNTSNPNSYGADMELHEIYNTLNSPWRSLVLPVFHCTQNAGETTMEINGLAVFDKDG